MSCLRNCEWTSFKSQSRRCSLAACESFPNPPSVVQALLEVVGLPCPCLCGAHEHVYDSQREIHAENTSYSNLPLQVVRSRILMLLVRAEGTNVSRRLMDQAVPDHLVLALEAFTTLAA